MSGFQAIKGVMGLPARKKLQPVFQQIFPTSTCDDMMTLTMAYHKYKREYVEHISFNPIAANLSKHMIELEACSMIVSAITLEHAALEVVYLYFDTATYDEIERDVKVTLKISCFYICLD